ncbi:ComEC/Rec2 family competence protein [Psychrobacter sp. I-STPA10]|uniref:ComEC/Rec2 family competence protein n=1 Tax=Psychrobacter sp. I-STPA10 TaxID=2585769 RepID=UPI001E5734CE|nr:ComEC/Rec2 family competence protein [Psychrobacter sp. I-STPA10]
MIWIGGLLALVVILTVLAVPPPQLQLLLQSVPAEQLQTMTWVWLCIAMVAWLLHFLLSRFLLHHQQVAVHACATAFLPTANNPENSTNTLVTQQSSHWLLLYRGGQGFVWLLILVAWLLAVVCHTLVARQAYVQQSLEQVVYVEAMLRPVALSDKQLLTANNSTDKTAVSSYRLLATLADVQPFDAVLIDGQQADAATLPHRVTNPLAMEQNSQQDSQKLPSQLTVLLQTKDLQYQWLNQLAPTQQVKVQLALYPVEPKANDDGFDYYRWLATRHATATARIISAEAEDIVPYYRSNFFARLRQQINQQRFELRAYLQQQFGETDMALMQGSSPANANFQAMAVTLSLLTGDRSLISKHTTELYQYAGISHLLAISGTHVLFLAIWLATFVIIIINSFCPRMYRVVSRWQIRYVVAVMAAFMYAWFTGFDVPAARTAWMLLLLGGLRYLLVGSSLFKPLLLLAVLMAWADPFILWQAGFWLSFTAVVMLLAYSQYVSYHSVATAATMEPNNNQQELFSLSNLSNLSNIAHQGWRLLKSFFWLQCWMFAVLLPLTLWLFGKVSIWGVLVNLFAIGIYGWILVPLNLLAGMVYFIVPSVANIFWQIDIFLLAKIHILLTWLELSSQQSGWLYTPITLPFLAVIYLSVLPWLLPKGLLSRWLSLPAICLSILLLAAQSGRLHGIVHSKSISPQGQTLMVRSLPVANTVPYSMTSATLLMQAEGDRQAWLLLSAYPVLRGKQPIDGYQYKKGDEAGIQSQAQKLSQTLNSQLRKQGINKLTGIIVQTPTAFLADTVSKLRVQMPINYYWLAGNRQKLVQQIADNTDNTGIDVAKQITPRPCTPTQQWQSSIDFANNEQDIKDGVWQLQAITGWNKVADNRVWGCSIVLRSNLPVVLDSIDSKHSHIYNSATHQVNVDRSVGSIVLATPIDAANESTTLIFNASQDAKLWQLWSLLCPADKAQSVTHQTWITPAAAYFSQQMVDELQPDSLFISDTRLLKPSASLQDVQLTWQTEAMHDTTAQ